MYYHLAWVVVAHDFVGAGLPAAAAADYSDYDFAEAIFPVAVVRFFVARPAADLLCDYQVVAAVADYQVGFAAIVDRFPMVFGH